VVIWTPLGACLALCFWTQSGQAAEASVMLEALCDTFRRYEGGLPPRADQFNLLRD
jgi:hypothetical protein